MNFSLTIAELCRYDKIISHFQFKWTQMRFPVANICPVLKPPTDENQVFNLVNVSIWCHERNKHSTPWLSIPTLELHCTNNSAKKTRFRQPGIHTSQNWGTNPNNLRGRWASKITPNLCQYRMWEIGAAQPLTLCQPLPLTKANKQH